MKKIALFFIPEWKQIKRRGVLSITSSNSSFARFWIATWAWRIISSPRKVKNLRGSFIQKDSFFKLFSVLIISF